MTDTRDRHAHPLVCGLCGRSFARRDTVPVEAVRPQISERLDRDHPDWRKTGTICLSDLAEARRSLVEELLIRERGELGALEHDVIDSLARHETLTSDVDAEFQGTLSFGDRLADRVASFGGSWTFIILFAVVVALWMLANAIPLLLAERFDPYPFILLNLVLSCIAAVQAPFIMMSQRRQEAKDRLRSQNDYRVNLKAELEIRQLHEKLDHLLIRQWERLTEIQQVQIELLEDLARRRGS
ncbi:Uncharacterized membrane protein [Tistlia consotensis]|uniref:Uncharacterized membrane protein n=1 Tax=Tistlia consotensis USBA 355 TaxID=560819 RepID=A0A1Y6C6E6_9PROT|nr:DUF1003 domain-containing protein [Tistlia consotensis]SMF47706.1 Uncharacterized membrane protein [Tistlia consotensis USBA 355]SNR82146.1 Uncharacterized membrane protein [Tistlia consotensis]